MGLGLEVRDLSLTYSLGQGRGLEVLAIPHLSIPAGAAVGITGPSGSGKTSLLYVLTGLERPQRGQIAWDGADIVPWPEAACDRWRRRTVGFVFQDFHLFPGLSALGNVLLPATFEHVVVPRRLARRARELLGRVGLQDRPGPAGRLSRGELQRVALARALLFAPPVLVADEPTASLDAASAETVADLLLEIGSDTDSTLLVVTHDPALLERLDPVHTLANGRLALSRTALVP